MTLAKPYYRALARVQLITALAFAIGIIGQMCPARAQGNQPIGVTVDGSQISFPGTQPVELHGSVLVPLRGVFQALGARVDYDAVHQVVTAHRHGRTIVVPIGSSTATVNGQPQELSVPAQTMNGSTMVPLRFVAEALGEYVEWGAQTHMVTITTPQRAPIVAAPPPRPDFHGADADEAGAVIGTVRRIVFDSRPPKLIIRVNGVDQAIPVRHDATIVRGPAGHESHPAALGDIHPGDHVFIHENEHGFAVRIWAAF